MIASARPIGLWLARRAENVAAAMLAAMFAAFLLQIIFRYALNLPIGWTHEISVVLWVWLVLWGAAFVVTEREEITVRHHLWRRRATGPRRVMCVITGTVHLSSSTSCRFPQ